MLPCQSQSCPSISALGGAAGKNQEYGRWERARLLLLSHMNMYLLFT